MIMPLGFMSFTLRVAVGLIAGLILGFAVSGSHMPWLMRVPNFFDPIGAIFVNAVRLTVIPIVVLSLMVGIASSGGVRQIGRVGGRALALMRLGSGLRILRRS
jgi:proton glutamate symport protein